MRCLGYRSCFNHVCQSDQRMRVPQLPKAPDGFEPPQKAMLAFPFPLGYGAISARLREPQTTKQQRVQTLKSGSSSCRSICLLGGVRIRYQFPFIARSVRFISDFPLLVRNPSSVSRINMKIVESDMLQTCPWDRRWTTPPIRSHTSTGSRSE
jgi:hypothetical protein